MSINARHSAPRFVNGEVSFWMRSSETVDRRAPLSDDVTVDVAIVGGGLTGLWTAYYLKQAQPSLQIAIIEREHVGFGASGRNGGWMSAEPAGQFRRCAKSSGVQAARNMQSAMFGAVTESVDVARREGFDEDLRHDGLIHVATSAAQLARTRHHVAQMKEQGWRDDDVFELGPSELAQRVRVEGARWQLDPPLRARASC